MIYCIILAMLFARLLAAMDIPPTPLLIKEVINNQLIPRMTLQEMSRLKCTCKGYGVVDIENLLEKHSYALHRLFTHFSYDQRTLILAHYAMTKNKRMFTFLRDKEKGLRDYDVNYFSPLALTSLECCMELHVTEYSTPEKIQKIRLKQLKIAANLGAPAFQNTYAFFLKKILPGSRFNIWDIKIVSSKKLLSAIRAKQSAKNMRRQIVHSICISQDADLLLAIMGDIIEPRALKYVFGFSEKPFIEALREKNAFIENAPDKTGKYFADYLSNHIPSSARTPGSKSYGNLIH